MEIQGSWNLEVEALLEEIKKAQEETLKCLNRMILEAGSNKGE